MSDYVLLDKMTGEFVEFVSFDEVSDWEWFLESSDCAGFRVERLDV